jgi:hypothetical protein
VSVETPISDAIRIFQGGESKSALRLSRSHSLKPVNLSGISLEGGLQAPLCRCHGPGVTSPNIDWVALSASEDSKLTENAAQP